MTFYLWCWTEKLWQDFESSPYQETYFIGLVKFLLHYFILLSRAQICDIDRCSSSNRLQPHKLKKKKINIWAYTTTNIVNTVWTKYKSK